MGIAWWIKNGRYFSKEYKVEFVREKFWGFVMMHFKRLYKWCEKNLKCDTLPF